MEENHKGGGNAASSMYFAVFVPGSGPAEGCRPVMSGAGDAGSVAEENNPGISSGGGAVFENLADAVQMVKKHKGEGARFKSFSTSEAAKQYAMGDVRPDTPCRPDTPSGESVMRGLGEEEKPPFPDPSRPQLTILKKAIEHGDMDTMRTLLHENPRYLVNCSGDTPTIVYAGCRYNALHLGAKAGNLKACQLVLYLINNPEYLNRLYPYCTSPDITDKRRDFLLDLYLNTPDKGANETPLHFASKLGHAEIVELLMGFEQCQRHLVNKYGETPEDLACAKAPLPPQGEGDEKTIMETKKRIVEMLSIHRFYVGLYRPQDYTGAPVIRPPSDSRPSTTWRAEEKKDGGEGRFPFHIPPPSPPPVAMPELCLAAYTGPMSAEKAAEFFTEWNSNNHPSPLTPVSAKFGARNKSGGRLTPHSAHIKRSDLHKGMERVGRKLAKEMEVPWTEFWPFLKTFADFSSEDGLRLLQEYLESKESQNTDVVSEEMEELAGAGILRPVQEYTSSPIGRVVESRFREFFSPIRPLEGEENLGDSAKGKIDFERGGMVGPPDDIPVSMERQISEDNDIFEDSLSVFEKEKGEMTLLAEEFENLQVTSISDLSEMAVERTYSVFGDKSKTSSNNSGTAEEEASSNSGTDRGRSDGDDSVMGEEDEESDEVYATPPSTPPATYLVGRRPTKMDFDVFLALEDVWQGRESELLSGFPCVGRWCRVMTVFTPQERQKWPGIDSPRAKLQMHPGGRVVTSPLAHVGD